MILKTIDFTVTADAVTPNTPQFAGHSGDNCAVLLRFAVPFDDCRYRLEIVDGCGEYDTTALLDVLDGTVSYEIPSSWTTAGVATVRLVAVEEGADGTETVRFHFAPAYLAFNDREDGEPRLEHLRPAWQEALDEAQLFLKAVEQKLHNGDLKGEKGDKGDTGDVSVIDELELIIDGGSADGEIEFLTADHVVEQGTDGIWTYRKWESGLAECFGVLNTSVASTQAWGSTHYYGKLEGVSFPASFFVDVPAVLVSVSDENGNFFVTNRSTTAEEVGELFAVTVVAVENETAIRLNLEAKGRWK